MLRGEWFAGVVRLVLRRPLVVLGVLGALVVAALFGAAQLAPSASTDTLVGKGSGAYKATQRFKREFGDEAVVVLVRGELQRLVLTPNLGHITALEGCIGGHPPTAQREQALRALPPVCREFAALQPAKAVYGPGTFINTAVSRAEEWLGGRARSAQTASQAACDAATKASKSRGDSARTQARLCASARNVVMSQFQQELVGLAVRYNITSTPRSLEFISALVFDGKGGIGAPKARFAYLFPSKDAAMITVRLRPNLTDAERSRAIDMIRRATGERAFRLDRGRYVVTGVPVVVDGLAGAVQRSIFVLLGAALVVMAATLALVFRTRMRLLPLLLALCAAALTYGGLALVGGNLTMASIAVLPVLIGLAVDYAIQFQARWDEQRARGRPPEEAATAAAAAGGPTIAAAGLATAAGFLALLLSPVPMVRSFALMLVAGILLAFACVLTAGFVLLVRFGRARDPRVDVPPVMPRARARAASAWARLSASAPAGWLAAGRARLARWWRRAFELSLERPRAVLGVAAVVALLGLVATFFHTVESDVRKLVPQNLQALRDAEELQTATGVSGEIDVTVTAKDLTDPQVIAWMTRFQDKVLADHGYSAGSRSCRVANHPPELCPAVSLPDLFRSGTPQTAASVKALLDAVPRYFSQAAISQDRRTANLAFGIRLMPLDRQQGVIDSIRRTADDPALKRPAGVTAQVAGLPVLAAEANGKLASPWWRIGTLLGSLLLVFGVLWLLSGRDARVAGVPLIPVALASGWSGAILWLLHIPLNPMSVTLGALVVAIATEFSVLISARYREERRTGSPPVVAIERAYVSTGTAVVASGVTAIAGFAVLITSDIAMLRQFGISTVVDLGVALLGVLLVLPAALLWAEQHGAFALRDLDPRPAARAALRAARRVTRPGALVRLVPSLPRRLRRRA
ncbi:MAG: uncharacterized protein QOJ12_2807 [Thermoleophilales bacterium]|nr:uncharacterized protein [Thermoleophilales bacterium]